jgi:hypothetical protein
MGWYGLDRTGSGYEPVEGSCERGEPSGSLKLLGIFWMAAQLAAFHEGLSSVSKQVTSWSCSATQELPNSCYMPCPSHPPWLDHSNYVWREVQVMKLPTMQFFFTVDLLNSNQVSWKVVLMNSVKLQYWGDDWWVATDLTEFGTNKDDQIKTQVTNGNAEEPHKYPKSFYIPWQIQLTTCDKRGRLATLGKARSADVLRRGKALLVNHISKLWYRPVNYKLLSLPFFEKDVCQLVKKAVGGRLQTFLADRSCYTERPTQA